VKPFILDPRLDADSVPVANLELSAVRLMQDATYPWLLLVPRRPDLVEIIDLGEADRARLMEEVAMVARALKAATACDKLNVAALGNQVPQLHVHVIARFRADPAWPSPVWGKAPPRAWELQAQQVFVERLHAALGG
jgi:diadenosine tetraphosphate (Ap4A) HIT family hydrolase